MPTAPKPIATLDSLKYVAQQSPPLMTLVRLCQETGCSLSLVGGAVRDWLMTGELSTDLDVVVPAAQAEGLAHLLANTLDGKVICLDPTYQIYRVVVFPEMTLVDIAGCIGDTIVEDLGRRDLTVNAMAYDLLDNAFLDPHHGLDDLNRGRIQMISRKNMLDDPLRLLRVFRVGAELGFEHVNPETWSTVVACGERLIRVAQERIHYELMKLLSARHCASHVKKMADAGILEVLFPEMTAMHQVMANQYHHLGLMDHTLELVTQCEAHWDSLPDDLRTLLLGAFNPFSKRLAVARLACLFHDLGKPATMAYDPALDRFKFYGHEAVSAEMTQGIALRYKWGKTLAQQVTELVRWHLYPADMLKPQITQKGIRKFFRRLGPVMPEMMLLALADRFSAKGPAISAEELSAYKAGLIELWRQFQTFQVAEETRTRLLTGDEIMKRLNIPPGPTVGHILTELDEAVLNGELNSRDDAMAWLETKFGSSGVNPSVSD